MNRLDYRTLTNQNQNIRDLLNSPTSSTDLRQTVIDVLEDVQARKDEAISEYTQKFDGIKLLSRDFRVTETEFKDAEQQVSESVKSAIITAAEYITKFHQKQLDQNVWNRPGDFHPRVLHLSRHLPDDDPDWPVHFSKLQGLQVPETCPGFPGSGTRLSRHDWKGCPV